jgi:hypothetical protein
MSVGTHLITRERLDGFSWIFCGLHAVSGSSKIPFTHFQNYLHQCDWYTRSWCGYQPQSCEHVWYRLDAVGPDGRLRWRPCACMSQPENGWWMFIKFVDITPFDVNTKSHIFNFSHLVTPTSCDMRVYAFNNEIIFVRIYIQFRMDVMP